MGVVWQGHDERLNRPVAVKKLLPRPGRQVAKAVARCLREGRIAARLNHPNATTVVDVVDEDGVPCLVMEYLPSRSLATAIAEAGTLPSEEVAAALAAAHTAGIVHRDITPGNILLGDGSVKLTDFGISRSADDVTATRTGLIGTPAFRPALLACVNSSTDGRSGASDNARWSSKPTAEYSARPRAYTSPGSVHLPSAGRGPLPCAFTHTTHDAHQDDTMRSGGGRPPIAVTLRAVPCASVEGEQWQNCRPGRQQT